MPQPFATPPTVVILGGEFQQVSIQCLPTSTPERPAPTNRLHRYGFGPPDQSPRRQPATRLSLRGNANGQPACIVEAHDQQGRLLCQVFLPRIGTPIVQTVLQQLGEIATIFVGMPTKQSQLKEYGPTGNVLTVRALRDFGINHDDLVHVDFNGRDVSKYQARSGDLVLSARSTSLKMGIVPSELDGVVVNSTIMAVRPLPALDSRLLAAYLSHHDGQAALAAIAQSGTIQMNLTVNAVSKLEIPLPPIDVQRQMAEMLATADMAYESAVEAARARKSLAMEVVMDQLRKGRFS